MLGALGNFLATIVNPLNTMGYLMTLNASSYTAATGTASNTMSTVAFATFAGPWIAQLGQISMGLGGFLTSLVTFLQGLTGLL